MFEYRAATLFDAAKIAMVARAFKKQGKPVVFVPLGSGVHAGHRALLRAARRIPGGIVIVASQHDDPAFAEEGVDAVFLYEPQELRTLIQVPSSGMQPAQELSEAVTRRIALMNLVGPSDVIFGEKDYELLVRTQQALNDLNIHVTVHSVPTVRMPDGIAISLRNATVPEQDREHALALSAAMTAGAHAAEDGKEAVLRVTHQVLESAGVTPDYVELRAMNLGEAPKTGDARLFVAATFGDVQLTDNAGVPVGVGFKNLD